MKDKLCQVWIKNHNMEANIGSMKLMVRANLVCAL